MKKSKLKSLVKSVRKTARKSIKLGLITELKKVAGELGQGSEKLNKEIEKGSKALAKKLSKEFKIEKAAILDATNKTITPKASKSAAIKKTNPARKVATKNRKSTSKASVPSKRVATKSPLKVKPKLVKKEVVQSKVENDSTLA